MRFADRLEAIGVIGAIRCYQYSMESDRNLAAPDTPLPKTEKEVWAQVTPERFENYMKSKSSNSMMDHYYDKLLHVAVFDPKIVQNDFLI